MSQRRAPRGSAAPRRSRSTRIAAMLAILAVVGVLVVSLGAGMARGQTGSSSTTSSSITTARDNTSSTAADDGATEAGEDEVASTTPLVGGGSVPFPADTVAPMPFEEKDPPLSLGAVYRVTGSSDDNPSIAVQFREPFDLPTDADYRVSVLVGNPTDRRLRSSMIVLGGKPTGRAELGDGASFEQLGPVPPPTADPSGLISISVPVNEAPSGGALWVEVLYGDAVSVSPYYSLDAVLGRSSDGKIAASPFGRVAEADGGPSDLTATMPAGPRLTVVNKSIIVESSTPTPTELEGLPVTGAVDTIVIAPDFNDESAETDAIRIDRTAGTIELLDGATDPPTDRSNENATWIVEGFGADPTAPGKLVFDLEAVSDALGIDGDTAGPALGLERELVLGDGKTVVADAVLATTAWFAANAVVESTVPATVAVSSPVEEPAKDWVLPAVIGGVALVLVLLSVLVMVRRRRAGLGGGDAADMLGAMALEVEEERRTQQHAAIKVDDEAQATADATGLPVTAVRTGELPVLPDQEPLVLVTVEDLEASKDASTNPPTDAPTGTPTGRAAVAAGAAGIFSRPAGEDGGPGTADDVPISADEPTASEPTASEPDASLSSLFGGAAVTAEDASPESPAAPPVRERTAFSALDDELDELTARLAALEEPSDD